MHNFVLSSDFVVDNEARGDQLVAVHKTYVGHICSSNNAHGTRLGQQVYFLCIFPI